jgi:hypothetical protein
MRKKTLIEKPYTGPWWTPLALAVASVGINMSIWGLVRLFGPSSLSQFEPLAGPGSVILLTTIGAFGAYYAYGVIAQLTPKPQKLYLILAVLVLLLSLIPDIDYPPDSPGYSSFAIFVLIAMHFTSAFIDVGLLFWIIHKFSKKKGLSQ